MKEVKVIFEGEAKVEYLKLKQIADIEIKKGIKSNNQTLFNSINQKIELLKINPVAGRAVEKSLIPEKYKNQGLTNLWVLLILVLLLLVPNLIFANTGPMPTMEIQVTYIDQPIKDTVFYSVPFTCSTQISEVNLTNIDLLNSEALDLSVFKKNIYDEKDNCYWQLISMPPPNMMIRKCKNSICTLGYMLPREFKLAVYLPDENKLFVSESVISRSAAHSKYTANLLENGNIEIKDKTSFFKTNLFRYLWLYLLSLIFTIFVEISIATLFIAKNLSKAKIIRTMIYANLISFTLLWVVLFFMFGNLYDYFYVLIIGELFVFLFEWLFIYFLNKKSITLSKTFFMVFLANFSSFLLGLVLAGIFGIFPIFF